MSQLTFISNFVDDVANCAHNRRAPYVGVTCFSHKGGMHVNAVQKIARSYEHIEPQAVGNQQHILVSELSGQSNILLKAEELGFKLEKGSDEVKAVLARVKELEKEGYEFEAAEASLELLIRRQLGLYEAPFKLEEYYCSYRRDGVRDYEICSATVKLIVGGKEAYTVAEGDGPVNALDAALRKSLEPQFPKLAADEPERLQSAHH